MKLVNLPFASLSLPSIALMQLQKVAELRFRGEVRTQIHYLNHDFADYFGIDTYEMFANSVKHLNTGVGDWMFRHVAFPEVEDNAATYFQRYYREKGDEEIRELVLQKREGLNGKLDELIDHYDLLSSDLVGCTSMFNQHAAALALLRKIKERDASVTTVMGGANCDAPMGKVVADNVDWVDFVFSGPSLQSFPRFIQYQMADERERCHEIDGVFSSKNEVKDPQRKEQGLLNILDAGNGETSEPGNGGPPKVAPIGQELGINETPLDLDYRDYLKGLDRRFPDENRVRRRLLFETSRGCWWGEKSHCTFCGLNGATMNYRAMEPGRAKGYFESFFQYASYASKIELHCVDNILPKTYLTEVFPHLETPENMRLFYEVKADLTGEDMRVLSKARVNLTQPGIEALSTDILKLMHKGTTAFTNVRFLKNCLRFSIEPAWNLLIGFPGEDRMVYKKYLEDIPLLTHLPPPTGVYPVRFDRYSPYFYLKDQYGLQLHPLDFYELTYPFEKEELEQMAYYFQDLNYGAAYMSNVFEFIDPVSEKVNVWRAAWMSEKGSPYLTLDARKGEPWVCDTRPGWEDEYPLEPLEAEVLDALNTPTRISNVAASVEGIPAHRVEEVVEGLSERGLVFREGDRLLSLVLPASAGSSVIQPARGTRDALRVKATT